MADLPLIVITVLVTILAERATLVPREIRRNNERIRNRDEDLRCWLEDRRKHVRREFLRIWMVEAKRIDDGPDYSVSQCQKVKDEALHDYREQLREAQRVVRDVSLSEQLLHRAMRRLSNQPILDLMSPSEKAKLIAEWETSAAENRRAAEELRAFAEKRRAEAGKSPLRPLRLAEIV